MSGFGSRVLLVREDGEPRESVSYVPDVEAGRDRRGAGVVVLGGEWGLPPELATRFGGGLADEGFFVVTTDIVRGKVAASAVEARRRAGELDHEQAIEDLVAALLELKRGASGKLGVLAFDLAATIAVEAACVLPQLDAVVHVGGPPPGHHARLARLRASVLFQRGEASTQLFATDVEDVVARAERAKVSVGAQTYPGCGDGFFTRPATDEERHHATIAWDRTRAYFASALS